MELLAKISELSGGTVRTELRDVSDDRTVVFTSIRAGRAGKQLQLNLLGSSDAVFQQRNRDLAIADGGTEGLSLPLLRETRMPAVLLRLGPPARVGEHASELADAVVVALERWVNR